MKKYPSQERLKELFDYDPEGFLVWRSRDDVAPYVNSRYFGKRAGCYGVRPSGVYFNNIVINQLSFRACEIVWIWHKGSIAHGLAVRNKSESFFTKIDELWLSKPNCRRGGRHANRAADGYIGVTKRGKSFRACLNSLKLGTFSTSIAAAAAVDAKRKELNPDETLFNLNFNFDFEPYRLKKGRPATKGDAF